MIKIEMQEIELKPVSRRGLMMVEVCASMTPSQMYEAVSYFRDSVDWATWERWLDEWQADRESENKDALDSLPAFRESLRVENNKTIAEQIHGEGAKGA